MRESPRRPGRFFLDRWPSTKAMARIRQRIRELTDRRYAAAPTDWVVERLNQTLRGWGAYFPWGELQPEVPPDQTAQVAHRCRRVS
jgi:hypothetical protein